MKGHIKQRGERSWSIVIELPRDPITGKRRQQWHTVKGTKRDAEKTLREIQYSLDKGTYVKPNQITVGEWLTSWLQNYVFMNTSPRTLESYSEIVNKHLIPALGMVKLSQLEPQQVQSYYAKMLTKGRTDGKGGLSARSVIYHHRILSKSLSYAVKMGVTVRNIADAVDPPRAARVTMRTLSAIEVNQFLDAARENSHYVFFSTLLFTGLRRGELLALKWRNLDLGKGTLNVVETAYQLRNGEYILKEPKTANSRRSVTLPQSLIELLKGYRADQELYRIQLGVSLNTDDFVFSNPDGSPLSPGSITLAFRRIIKKAGLRHIRVHDLRHTHATLMLSAGVHPKVVSERLGHASISITLDIYSHVLPGLQEAAAEKFDSIFSADVSKNNGAYVSKMLATDGVVESEPSGTRTQDHLIKSQMLYQLS
jgi:integrase